MIERLMNLDWYKGLILLEVLDNVLELKWLFDKFLRLLFQDVYKIGGIGIVLVGWVEMGIIRLGMLVCFVLMGLMIEVKFVEMYYELMFEVYLGDNVGFNVKNVVVKDLKRGYVVLDLKNDFVKEVVNFMVQVIIMNYLGQIGNGYVLVLDCYMLYIVVKFVEILMKVDR